GLNHSIQLGHAFFVSLQAIVGGFLTRGCRVRLRSFAQRVDGALEAGDSLLESFAGKFSIKWHRDFIKKVFVGPANQYRKAEVATSPFTMRNALLCKSEASA